MGINVWGLFYYLNVIGIDLGSDGCYALDDDYQALAALAADFYKDAFYIVELAAYDADAGALGDVYLVGTEVGDFFTAALTYCHEAVSSNFIYL